MKKVLLGSLLVGFFVGIGFLREMVFINMNESIVHYTASGEDTFDLVMAKYIFTLAFTLGYLILTLLLVWILFEKRELLLITAGCFGLLIVAALALYGAGTLLASPETGYRMARALMGLAQSPVPAMLLLPSFYFFARNQ